MLCTHLKFPAMWPGRPKLESLSPVWRSMVSDLHVGAISDEDVALSGIL